MTKALQTSPQGIAFLERKEDVVLKAYRDVVGFWTIGAGLTKNSGVVTPRPGMVITRDEATRLLKKALARNYEPRVNRALPGVAQHVFDGAVSFDFNTGAIDSASWVGAFKRGDMADAERRFKLWNKGGGKRLPGLVNRRNAEWPLIRHGDYGPGLTDGPKAPNAILAGIGRTITQDDQAFAADALRSLGYRPGMGDHPSRVSVEAFQRDHDLSVDGIIGPATLATLRRQMDARRKLAQAAAAGGAGGAVEAAPTPAVDIPDYLGLIVLGLAALWALWLLWRYRDWVAAKVQRVLPGLARRLRSV